MKDKELNIKDLDKISGGSNNWTTAYEFSNEISFNDIPNHPSETIYCVSTLTQGLVGGKNWFGLKFKSKQDYNTWIFTVVETGKSAYFEGAEYISGYDATFKYYLTKTQA